jgi:hypothetical protein
MPGGSLLAPKQASVGLHVYVADCDALFRRAVAAGATVVMPLTDMFWGDRYGQVRDPFGHVWSIATHKEDLSPDEMARRMAQMAPPPRPRRRKRRQSPRPSPRSRAASSARFASFQGSRPELDSWPCAKPLSA